MDSLFIVTMVFAGWSILFVAAVFLIQFIASKVLRFKPDIWMLGHAYFWVVIGTGSVGTVGFMITDATKSYIPLILAVLIALPLQAYQLGVLIKNPDGERIGFDSGVKITAITVAVLALVKVITIY